MASPVKIEHILDQSLSEPADRSGKTALDFFIEELNKGKPEDREAAADDLSNAMADLVRKGARYVEAARQLIQRSQLRSRKLADAIERAINSNVAKDDVELRLQLSLTLMDLGRPRTVVSLQRDSTLRDQHIGEWLTLIAANENYKDVESAFEIALRSGLISVSQVCIKAESIRRQFGDKLVEFLKAMAAAAKDDRDRRAITSAAKEMYGLNISVDLGHASPRPKRAAKIEPKTWVSARMFNLLAVVAAKAQERRNAV